MKTQHNWKQTKKNQTLQKMLDKLYKKKKNRWMDKKNLSLSHTHTEGNTIQP